MSLTEEQIAESRTGIGGSQAAAALGLSPWQSPLALFLQKSRPPAEYVPSIPTAAMHWGTILEPVIRQEYARLTERTVRMPPGTMRHAKHHFMIGHVDGVTDDSRVFEAKTSRSAEGWGDSGTDQVPHHYLIQVQHYLAITGFKLADLAVLIGASDFRIYTVPADLELQEMIIEGERDFWKCVESGTPPGPDFDNTEDLDAVLKRLYPGTNGKTMQATPPDVEYRRIYEHAAAAAKNYERVADGAKQHLLYMMGESARLVFPDGVQLTRKITHRKGYSVEPTEYVDARFSRSKEIA